MVLLVVVAVLVLILLLVLVANALRLKPSIASDPLPISRVRGDDRSVERFREMLRSATVWNVGDPSMDRAPFDGFVPKLKHLYPAVFSELDLTLIETYGIVLRWEGADGDLDPIVLMAHHDVVEADPSLWRHDPFAADIEDGKIWARGAVDTKCVLAGLLEAVDILLADGFVPPRDVYLCSSNCEEGRGDTAPCIVSALQERGISPYLVLDEGGAVVDDAPLGLQGEFAVIGVSEKGVFDALIVSDSPGGHASVPSLGDATAKLVSGLEAMQRNPPRTEALRPRGSHVQGIGGSWRFRPEDGLRQSLVVPAVGPAAHGA